MRVLILGATGMLGHKAWQILKGELEAWVAARSSYRENARYGLFDPQCYLGGTDVSDFDTVVRAVARAHPEIIVNCIGIIKQLPTAKDPLTSLTVNSLFPHRLANLCQASDARLIHISTDCVFSGRKGMYTEEDVSDAEDLYGRSKFLGEVDRPRCLTLRTSIIGRELNTANGLVEWFLSNAGGKVRGFTHAWYSGLTALALARVIADVIEHHPDLSGVYQISSDPITKYDLLCFIRKEAGISVEIEPDPSVQVNRTLDSSRFRLATGFVPQSWPAMIREMVSDPTPYAQWRSTSGS